MTSVECQWLVYKHRIVHRDSEQNLCAHQTIDIRRPDVKSNPQLGEEPQQPHPNMLPKHMFINITQRHQPWPQSYLIYQKNVRMHGGQVKGEIQIRFNTESLKTKAVSSVSGTWNCVTSTLTNQEVERVYHLLTSSHLHTSMNPTP
jgi:hypothetical protein